MASITPEDKVRFFPLLDDMGGMEEIYTVDGLQSRIRASISQPYGTPWRTKWLKGVNGIKIYHSSCDPTQVIARVIYYGQVYEVKLYKSKISC